MGPRADKPPLLVITDDERATLERWARRHHSAQSLALRCRIVLACAQSPTVIEVARSLGLSRTTVRRWRDRFAQARLDGLHDEPRPGAPRTIGDDDVERVIVKILEQTPPDATHWSTRSMAAPDQVVSGWSSNAYRCLGVPTHEPSTNVGQAS